MGPKSVRSEDNMVVCGGGRRIKIGEKQKTKGLSHETELIYFDKVFI
jgi:hypothetical protein